MRETGHKKNAGSRRRVGADVARGSTRRRLLITLGASALGVPGIFPAIGRAQAPRTYRVALLFGGQKEGNTRSYDALRDQLSTLGYVEGRNLILDVRFGGSTPERAQTLAEELIALRPDVVLGLQGNAVVAATRVPATVPAVIIASGNPVDAGYVASFARPGGHVTGISLLATELVGKRIELLKEILPRLKTVAVLADPQHPGEHRERAESEAAAQKLGIRILYYPVRDKAALDSGLIAAKSAGAEALVVFPDGVTAPNRGVITQFTLRNQLPAVAGWASFVEDGCLLSYGPNIQASYARVAYFIDRILKGTRPAELPVELPTVVELAVNRKTAKSLGITIPNSILVRADKVID